MRTILVVANETIGGRRLIEAVRSRAEEEESRFVLVVPQSRPKHGNVVYDDAVFEAAQVRVDLALSFIRAEGIRAVGEVGDTDPYNATLDGVRAHAPDEIIISTYPAQRSGWMRRDLVERVADGSGLSVEHVVNDIDQEGLPFALTLVVANRTASGAELLGRLTEKAGTEKQSRVFLVVVPRESPDGEAAHRARTRLGLVLGSLRGRGLVCAGMIGDADPYTATMNALQSFRVSDVVISTHPAERSGWLRADLVERVKRATPVPVEHVVVDLDATGPTAGAVSVGI